MYSPSDEFRKSLIGFEVKSISSKCCEPSHYYHSITFIISWKYKIHFLRIWVVDNLLYLFKTNATIGYFLTSKLKFKTWF